MAKFQPAYDITNGNEGGYQNNPHDLGNTPNLGTYRGIAVNFHPAWAGWRYVRNTLAGLAKQPPYGTKAYSAWVKTVNTRLQAIPALQELVMLFYKAAFWDNCRLGEINSQDAANWIYDHVVNAGGRGVKWAQIAANVTPDGGLGPKTLAAINKMKPAAFLARAQDVAAAYRLDKAESDSTQIQFLRSWLTRDGQPANIIAMVMAAVRDGRLDEMEVAGLKTAMEATA